MEDGKGWPGEAPRVESDLKQPFAAERKFAKLFGGYKICLGSRPEPKFQDAFRGHPSFRMQDLTLPDILSFVSRRLCANPRFMELQRREPQYAADLVVSITRRSSGVFLWVHLVVRSLLDGLGNSDRIQDLRRRLDCIPPELDDLYSSIINNLDPFYLEHAS